MGLQTGNFGYLSYELLAFAPALFVLTKDNDPSTADSHLSPDKGKLFRSALRMLDRKPEIVERIRALAG